LTQDGLTIGKKGYGLKATDSGITIGKKLEIFENRITIGEERNEFGEVTVEPGFKVTEDGLKIAGWTVNSDELLYENENDPYKFFISPSGATTAPDISGDSEINIGYTIYAKNAIDGKEYKFGVTAKGELHAQGAKISGYIEANSGYIGNIKIENGGIASEASKIATSPSFDGGL
jgi:hypothetical protein